MRMERDLDTEMEGGRERDRDGGRQRQRHKERYKALEEMCRETRGEKNRVRQREKGPETHRYRKKNDTHIHTHKELQKCGRGKERQGRMQTDGRTQRCGETEKQREEGLGEVTVTGGQHLQGPGLDWGGLPHTPPQGQ